MPPIVKSGIPTMLAALSMCVSGSHVSAQTFTTFVSFNGTNGANSTAGLI
ncbi:MAG TPA: hypothetical protein VGG56_17505 [Terracidiphilus sp.]